MCKRLTLDANGPCLLCTKRVWTRSAAIIASIALQAKLAKPPDSGGLSHTVVSLGEQDLHSNRLSRDQSKPFIFNRLESLMTVFVPL